MNSGSGHVRLFSDSPVGVYGGFMRFAASLAVWQPAGIILDDMFQPLSIIRQGYRSVVDPAAYVYDTWPKEVEGEFHRKVRTLAGNFQLFQLAPWTLTPQNRVLFQLVSHKVMRLVRALSVGPDARLRDCALSRLCTLRDARRAPDFGWIVAIAGLRIGSRLHRVAAPAGALLVLNAAAVVGLYKFLVPPGHSGRYGMRPRPRRGPYLLLTP